LLDGDIGRAVIQERILVSFGDDGQVYWLLEIDGVEHVQTPDDAAELQKHKDHFTKMHQLRHRAHGV
jgi:hypothetical protein